MDMDDIGTRLLYTTVLIRVKKTDGKIHLGTGFVFVVNENSDYGYPFLITNYHVIEDMVSGFFEFHLSVDDLPSPRLANIKFSNKITYYKLGELDLIAIPLSNIFLTQEKRGQKIFYEHIDQGIIPTNEQFNDFSAIEDIVFVGYPHGIYDTENNIPIIRQGITATPIWNNFKGEEKFLIDSGVCHGSSGSPVFIYNPIMYPTKKGITAGKRLLFVGVIDTTLINNSSGNYIGLGEVIQSRAIYRELQTILKRKS